ncbi:MAG: zinc finger domain-containing protein [Huintestinicola sp.]
MHAEICRNTIKNIKIINRYLYLCPDCCL